MLLATDLAARRPPRGHDHPHRQRHQLGRERRARRRGLRRRRRPARPDDRRAGRARAVHGRRSTSPPSPRSPAAARPRSTTPPSRPPRSRSGRARRSRSWWRSGSRCRARPTPLDVYRVLRATNPSPYMYLLRLEPAPTGSASTSSAPARRRWSPCATASSPRTRSRAPGGAGPPRRRTSLLEKDLRTDEKERAEHVMLVDLGRNDLGRVCEPGTVKVRSFFSVERYSHVMHLVSTVTGLLRRDRNAFDAVTACFPAGTLSGRAEAARDGDHRGAGAHPARALRRHRRLPRLRGQRRHRDRDPHGAGARRRRLRAGGRRDRGRLRPGRGGHRVPQQGAGGALARWRRPPPCGPRGRRRRG